MKTCRLLLIFTVCLFSGPVFPQLAFKDALTLRTLDHRLSEGQVQFLQQDSATLMDILKNHSVYSTYQGIAKDFENNPFIALSHSASQSIAPSDQPNVPSDFSLGGLSGFNVTHIADGLARFLVERTKQELSVAFFEKFKEQLEAQRQLQILFPSTFQRLEAIGDDIYRFSAYLESLRTAFQQDLTSLLPHLRQLIQDPSMDQVFAQNPVLRIILSDGLYLVMQLNDDKHIGDALNSYISYEASPAHLDSINSNIYPSLALLNTISQSLRNDTPANGSYWVRSQDFAELKDEVTLKLYLGLLYQQLELFEIEHNQQLRIGNRPVLDFLEKGNQDFSKFRDTAIALISPVVQEGKEIDVKLSYILNLQQQGQKANYTDFYELMQASLNFLETVKKTYQLVSGEKVPLGFDRFLKLTHSLGDMYVDINEKRYASAVSELVSLYQEYVVKPAEDHSEAVSQAVLAQREEFEDAFEKAIKDGENVAGLKQLLSNYEVKAAISKPLQDSILAIVGRYSSDRNTLKKQFEALDIEDYEKKYAEYQSRISDFLRTYGNFAATVARAENSAQVQEAIEAAALPAGSSRIKRNTAFNVALNGYVGLHYGYENMKINGEAKFKPTFGLSAPVGLVISTSVRSKPENGTSLSLFLSIVDVGALASFRFDDPETESVPDIELKDIVSPGAFFVVGLNKMPLSIGGGAQIGPKLHDVTATTVSTVSDHYVRYSVFVVVDIPILNFYTKPR